MAGHGSARPGDTPAHRNKTEAGRASPCRLPLCRLAGTRRPGRRRRAGTVVSAALLPQIPGRTLVRTPGAANRPIRAFQAAASLLYGMTTLVYVRRDRT